MQQLLPFTVLKPTKIEKPTEEKINVATALTVYGIETQGISFFLLILVVALQQLLPFTVLKLFSFDVFQCFIAIVATALTVYGIETLNEQNILL